MLGHPTRESPFKQILIFLETIVHGCSQKACNFIKEILQHRCFPLKYAKCFKDFFLTEPLRWLLLFSLKQKSKNEKIYSHKYIHRFFLSIYVISFYFHFLQRMISHSLCYSKRALFKARNSWIFKIFSLRPTLLDRRH